MKSMRFKHSFQIKIDIENRKQERETQINEIKSFLSEKINMVQMAQNTISGIPKVLKQFHSKHNTKLNGEKRNIEYRYLYCI